MITSVINYMATLSLDLNDSSEDSVLTSSERLFQLILHSSEKEGPSIKFSVSSP